ncbi:hypothetical protein [Companilactobacillus furfuricola]|uniref:hypothetical protein n=1 Tax=Companilactobacillus furfuricola TaxID=1462575 RepID=UPI000F77ECFF|nr:hypothetical protein [Companilactobacillus furfuricola]
MKEIFDDYINKNVTKYRLNPNIKSWYIANKWLMIFFLLFPLIMDLLFGTFMINSIVKSIIILIIGSIWVYLKYLFVKRVLVLHEKPLKPWKYNLYNAVIWGLFVAVLAIPSSGSDYAGGNFLINWLTIFIIGALFSLLFTSLEMDRFRLYLNKHK